MAEPLNNPDAAFLVYRDGDALRVQMRCCDISVKVDANDEAVDQAIAWHMSRVHGYIGAIGDEITLEALARRLPPKPNTD